MSESSNSPDERLHEHSNEHLDEMTGMLYVEGQLDRQRGQQVSAHAQDCSSCRILLRALERESRLLTRSMLEEDEPLPSRLAAFQQTARQTMQWFWWQQRSQPNDFSGRLLERMAIDGHST